MEPNPVVGGEDTLSDNGMTSESDVGGSLLTCESQLDLNFRYHQINPQKYHTSH